MTNVKNTWFVAIVAMILSAGTYACTDSNFAGGAAKSAGLTDKNGKNGGRDGADSDSGEPDSGNDANDGADGGADSGGGGGGKDSLGNNDSADAGGIDEDDSGDTDAPDGGDDGEVSSKTRHDATITRGEVDNPFEMKIETIIKGKTKSTQTLTFSENGKNDPTVAKLVCRNKHSTCLKITFKDLSGDNNDDHHIEELGTTTCAWAEDSGNSSKIDFDADGDEHSGIFDQGICKAADKDDQVTITCPDSTKLHTMPCDGSEQ